MSRSRVGLAVSLGALLLCSPTADAKYRLTVTLEPARPIALAPTRLIMRSDVEFPRNHGVRVFAVGPWRKSFGQASLEIRLARTAPRTLLATVRFPHAGRWHVSVPASPAAPPVDLWVRVRAPA